MDEKPFAFKLFSPPILYVLLCSPRMESAALYSPTSATKYVSLNIFRLLLFLEGVELQSEACD